MQILYKKRINSSIALLSTLFTMIFETWYNTCMRLGYDYKLKQSQNLSMNAEMIQSIQVLQLGSEELNEYINKELLENPILEMDNTPSVSAGRKNSDSKEEFYYENQTPYRHTLVEHLLEQLAYSNLDEQSLIIGSYIIHNIDSNGFLEVSLEEVAEALRTEMPLIESVLDTVQEFDPPGVAARSLQESLMIQLCRMGEGTPERIDIVMNDLEDLFQGKFIKLEKKYGLGIKECEELISIIKGLDPKPGSHFDSEKVVKYVIPDARIDVEGDECKVTILDEWTPKLMISSYYDTLKEQSKEDDELKEYIRQRRNSALRLIRNIDQRRETIRKVLNSIVNNQRDFILRGERYLKPLTLKDIASDVKLHESTVSRAVNNKYVELGGRVYEFKYFFSSAVTCFGKGDVSSESVKHRIKELIAGENKQKPYSDQGISDVLQDAGINVSRRTVTKYREALGLPSSRMRKVL